ncbi:4-hydroxy-tetrahydrodipicolinate synthase [Thermodesulfobacteriota bacterium]
MFRGSMVALVTPFRDGRIDEKGIDDLVEFHIASGTDAVVMCGTTGESAALDEDEHRRVVARAVAKAAGRVPIVAGTGTNSTKRTITLSRNALKEGADGLLVVTPYYVRPTQMGLTGHFKAVLEVSEKPVILYNVPSRTGANLEPETVARLAESDRVVAVKEASGSLAQACEIIRLCGERIDVVSGDDHLLLPHMAVGARGIISVTANIVPDQVKALVGKALDGDFVGAREIFYRLMPLNRVIFLETNPIPVKTALAMMGKIPEEFRLPLCPMSDDNRGELHSVLRDFSLL